MGLTASSALIHLGIEVIIVAKTRFTRRKPGVSNVSNPPLNRLLYPLHRNITTEEVDFKRSEAYSTISVNKLTIDEKKAFNFRNSHGNA
jgi:hypothetical protein